MSDVQNDDFWEVSKAFVHHYGLIPTQIRNYNDSIDRIKTIVESQVIEISEGSFIEFHNLYFDYPKHKNVKDEIEKTTPKKCFDLGLSLTSSLYVDIKHVRKGHDAIHIKKKYIGEFPIMVKSDLCPLNTIKDDLQKLASLQENINDVGGYFIVKGAAKVIVSQVRQAYNCVNTHVGKKTAKGGKPLFSLYTEIRTGSYQTVTCQVGVCYDSKMIGVVLPIADIGILQVGILFRALGIEKDRDIIDCILPFTQRQTEVIELLVKTLERDYSVLKESDKFTIQDQALNYIGYLKHDKKQQADLFDTLKSDENKKYGEYVLSKWLFPHIEGGKELKIAFLGYMVNKVLMCHFKIHEVEDRDNFTNKRVWTAGKLLEYQFYKCFNRFVRHLHKCIDNDKKNKKVMVVSSYISPKIITNNMLRALTTNDWHIPGMITQGISQQFDSFNRISSLSFLRKSKIQAGKEGGKLEKPRQVNASVLGSFCPSETPEGKQTGFILYHALSGLITIDCDPLPLLKLVPLINEIYPIKEAKQFISNIRIFIDNVPIGFTSVKDADIVIQTLKEFRRKLVFHPEVSIAYDVKVGDIHISTDTGRTCRGLVALENGKPKIQKEDIIAIRNGTFSTPEMSVWMTLMDKGLVEIIDNREADGLCIATRPSAALPHHIYCEMTPDMVQGVGVSTSPFNDHNQAPRNTYQASMAKQAIGVPGLNNQFLTKGKWHSMVYPQKPITCTRIDKLCGADIEPIGQNAFVIVCPWKGFNQEDSLVMCQDAVDRGFMCSYMYQSYEAVIKSSNTFGSKFEKFEIPPSKNESRNGDIIKLHNTSKLIEVLGKWCYVPEGIIVEKNDVLIGMTITHSGSNGEKPYKSDISISYNHKLPATIHSVRFGTNGEGYSYIRVITRQYRKPMVGDKFAARHGQKGTVGILLPASEMPLSKRYNTAPNIALNPLAFPGRMTIGMFVEMLLGTVLATSVKASHENLFEGYEHIYPEGFNGDASPFKDPNFVRELCNKLKKLGVNEFSNEEFINQQTGESFFAFCGVVYYQKLKHMCVDKMHARREGYKHTLHRQPTEGRSKNGGLRVGYMERDMMIAQGMPHMTQDRLFHQSDYYEVAICQICGLTAINDDQHNRCQMCSSNKVVKVDMPYGTKLLSQEFSMLNSVSRVITLPEPL